MTPAGQIRQPVPAGKLPGVGQLNVPEFDGKHMWMMTAAWKVTPPFSTVLLDTENLILTSGPGCFWCEQEYSLLLSGKPCQGDASPGWR